MRAPIAITASLLLLSLVGGPKNAMCADPRYIRNGLSIPGDKYVDQPYLLRTDDQHWLCVLTTGTGNEGNPGQHIVSLRSRDLGRAWIDSTPIEPPGVEASWAMPVKAFSGRIYVFYAWNGDDVRRLAGRAIRADMLGHYVFRYSDDHGRSWSPERYRIPVRLTSLDVTNDFGGRVQLFWGVGKPVARKGELWFGFSKIGRWLISHTESWLLFSPNLLEVNDPLAARWELLPEGDLGLRAPCGSIAEEISPTLLCDGALYAVFRSADGFVVETISRDGGRSWARPAYARFGGNGRPIKNPRGPAFVRRFSNGRYLLTFYNHGGRDFGGRNPLWLSGGIEREGKIEWSEPEIGLYDTDPETRIGYPDFIEENGEIYVSESDKHQARIHRLPRSLLQSLWGRNERIRRREWVSLIGERKGGRSFPREDSAGPQTRDGMSGTTGFTLGIECRLSELGSRVDLVSSTDDGSGLFRLLITGQGTVRLVCRAPGASHEVAAESEPGRLFTRRWHEIVVIHDPGPGIVLFLIDGRLCDGGTALPRGWTWVNADGWIPPEDQGLRVAAAQDDLEIRKIRLVRRPLYVNRAHQLLR